MHITQKDNSKRPIFIYRTRVGNLIRKKYFYPYANTNTIFYKRIKGWENFSRNSYSVSNIEVKNYKFSSKGLEIEIDQELCFKTSFTNKNFIHHSLNKLYQELRTAWEQGLVHGDLNKKNIILTKKGFKIIDIEPLIRVPLLNGGFELRTTYPHISVNDQKEWDITQESDQLSFNFFSSRVCKFLG